MMIRLKYLVLVYKWWQHQK